MGLKKSIGPKSARTMNIPTSKAPTSSAHSASVPTPSAPTSSVPISIEPSSNAPISSAQTPRASLRRVSATKADVHADVTPPVRASYVTVARHSYPNRLNLTSNTSARVSNASGLSKEGSNARRYVRRGGITGNSTFGGLWETPPSQYEISLCTE